MLPVLLRDKFAIVGNENQRLTRQVGNIVLELRKSRSALKSALHVFHEVKMFKYFTASIKQSDKLKTFKREFKKDILRRIKYV